MSVEADLNYIVDNGQEPILYVDWPEEEHNEVPHHTRTVRPCNDNKRIWLLQATETALEIQISLRTIQQV